MKQISTNTTSILISLALAPLVAISLGQARFAGIAQITGRVVSVGNDDMRVATGGQTVTVWLACIAAPEAAQAPCGKVASEQLKHISLNRGEVKRSSCSSLDSPSLPLPQLTSQKQQ